MPLRRLSARLLLAVRVVVLSLFILAVFSVVAFLLAMATAYLRGAPPAGAGLLSRCAVCGLIAGLFVAVFHLKKETIRLPVSDRDAFVSRVKAHLEESGYAAATETAERLVFRPSFRALLFGAGIEVRLADGTATVIGPKVYLEMLRRRLRLHNFLRRTDRVGCAPRGRRWLRRMELSMRVSPEQLPGVQRQVVEALRGADAEVICHLSVLARNEAGIGNPAVEGTVRQWLHQQHIDAAIHAE